ncbi:MAG: hypothetical protein E6772_03140 [Dysgonomonas sp.]|nr:hypothetical protein [Dysgonomonas sp.]
MKRYSVILFIVGVSVVCCNYINSKTQKNNQQITNNRIFGKLSKLQLDNSTTFEKNVIYSDTVTFIGYEDIGDYSRLCVEKDNEEYYFLYEFYEQEDLIEGNMIIVDWSVVDNHVIEAPQETYPDIVAKNYEKLK